MGPRRQRALILAAIQLGLVLSLAGKMMWDRAMNPRVWARTAPVDPMSVFRGRYVQVSVLARKEGPIGMNQAQLFAHNGELVARPTAVAWLGVQGRETQDGFSVGPLAYFIPENVPDPSRLQPGQELWAEVTVLPGWAKPRPIRLGIREPGGAIRPLAP